MNHKPSQKNVLIEPQSRTSKQTKCFLPDDEFRSNVRFVVVS